jgi:hypothetical protein
LVGVKAPDSLASKNNGSVRASAPVQNVKWVSTEAKDGTPAIVDSARVKAENSSVAPNVAMVRASAPACDVKWALAEAGE